MSDPIVVAPVVTVPGTPEHDVAMIAKADALYAPKADDVVVPEVSATVRPEHVPEKFWDATKGEINHEAWAKSYAELEKVQSNKTVDPTATKAEVPAEVAEPDVAKVELEKVGIDYTALTTEFADTGTLSEDSYKLLADKAGLSRELVDNYIEGQKARVASFEMSAYEAAGGKDQFAAMQTWAAANLSEADKTAFNEGVNGSEAHMRLAVDGLKAKYTAANGVEPNLQHGNNSAVTQGYESRNQMTADMKDPRYAKDPAFRKSVEQKVARSNIW
jgi:hypothetical protein